MPKMHDYSFITIWKIKAPLNQVWDAIYKSEDWPNWWRGVLKVETISHGDENDIGRMMHYTWKSVLPYKLKFDIISTQIEKPFVLQGDAIGELEGTGRWEFLEKDGITTTKYFWDVTATKKWMKSLAPLLKPLFKWNHNVVMKWGAKGLAKKLNAELLQY